MKRLEKWVHRASRVGAAFGLALLPAAAVAEDSPALALLPEMRRMLEKPVAIIAIRAQNERHATIDQATIDRLDKQWRAETKSGDQPLIAQLMGSPFSAYLVRIKAESQGLFSEVFVTDNVGLNVGQSSLTTDYWQGDEAKYQKTFLIGPDAVNVSKVEIDGKTGSRRQQIDFTILDPDTRKPIGAATMEVDLDELARRTAHRTAG
ncbi:hypothetical protein HL658_01010 [Azospirillum sp. RWY-5-1]|uniref:Uncharacterized protein n=1 Tax=Azospirillum oleiclasticum TaxID=2735135 RepID=A0ABX2T6J4_9PROT|nr:hypothetical protein [Azospirillum oleiclasticum]NYZ11113.1 hypothetical protein [Azospirillum oleiclasticum]NYZ18275.1 hypothetical protein [Azospirillum oleiclasticum]